MKKILAVLFIVLAVFLIYLCNLDKKVYYLALGDSFPECIENGPKMSKRELQSNNLNDCTNHVDFMVGTKDLEITGITEDGREILIFENGNFTKEFK